MGKVSLQGIEFHAFHGVYAEENQLGNRFTVDLHVETSFKNAMLFDQLEETVDYVQLYQIVKSHMTKPVKLLEHLGHLIIQDILKKYTHCKSIEVLIKKHNPPLGGLVDRSIVTIHYPNDYA
jgi:7,8-dihydroneopterin aldolase/epimerase/oxygenase